MIGRYDFIALSLTFIGLLTSLNSPLFTFLNSVGLGYITGIMYLLTFIGIFILILFIAGFRIPIVFYGLTILIITLAYVYKWFYEFSIEWAGLLYLLTTPGLIFIPISLIVSIIIIAVRDLRTPINVMYSSTFIKSFALSIPVSIGLMVMQGSLGLGVTIPRMNILQIFVIIIVGIILLVISVNFMAVSIMRRAGGGVKGKRRFIHVTESYPPIMIDDKPTYMRISDLHYRAYRMYRVYRGELSQQTIEEIIRILRRIVIFFNVDGYVYIYAISESFRLGDAVHKLDIAEKILTQFLKIDLVLESIEDRLKIVMEEALPRDLPTEIDRDRLRFIVGEKALGLVLVLEYSGYSYETRNAPRKVILNSGFYTIITDMGRVKHLPELDGGVRIASAQATVLLWNIMKETTLLTVSDKYTPLYLRKGRIHMDGSSRIRIRDVEISIPQICISIPLGHHIFLLGKSRSGKSVGIANIVRYINSNGGMKVVIFDWVGNFTSLPEIIPGAKVLYPGEDIFIDLYNTFNKRELVDLYEEASILFFKDVDRASFTPIVYDLLVRLIDDASSHGDLLYRIEQVKEVATYRDERDASVALLRRLRPLDPMLYTPVGEGGDIIDILNKNDVVIIDLSSLPSEGDAILFTLACLKVLSRVWNSGMPQLYIVIDEAHRLAPKIRGVREWILSRLAREGAKYNLYLLLADQTLTSISPDVWNNIGHIFIFTIDNPDDLRLIYPLFYAWEKRYKLTGRTLEEFISSRLRMDPGECFLIRFGGEEPIECYFENTRISEADRVRIDEDRFRGILAELNINDTRDPNIRGSIIHSRRLLRRHSVDDVLDKVSKFIRDGDRIKLELDGVTLLKYDLKDNRYKVGLPLKIFLKYYNRDGVIDRVERIKPRLSDVGG